jgi:putative DNA primase/helicase
MTLNADHLQQLTEGSSIAPEVARERGYLSLTDPGDVQDLGFSKVQSRLVPVLAIPVWDVYGQQTAWQIRPDSPRLNPKGKENKYENRPKHPLTLDVHPRVQPQLQDPRVPLWITEGIKKGDALVSRGAVAIALMGGVWGFKGTNKHGGKVLLPEWQDVPLNGRLVYVVFDSDIYVKPDVDAALRALYRMLRGRDALPGLVRWPEEYRHAKTGIDDFLVQGHTLDDVLAMVPPMGYLPTVAPAQCNGHALQPLSRVDRLLTDTSNAAAFVADHGKKLRYCYAWKTWLVWTGTHWERDTSGEVMRLAKETIKRLVRQIEVLDDEKQIGELMAHIKASLSTAKLKAMLENAQSEPGIAVQPQDLDTNVWLLNCTNGTLDLRTGEIRPHAQADLITKCLPIAYDPDALYPLWGAFLRKAMQADLEMIDYLQRTTGYTLTGSTREQCLFLCHGPTKTGKSTFLAILRALLAGYGKQTDMQTFLHKDRPEVRNDLADLAGARYVYAVESQEGKRLAEGLLKQITGGVDGMKARFLYEELFEFTPQFKAYIGTNHLPRIDDTDDAIWERIKRIPFVVQIPKEERDKDLETKLKAELPGILAWAVQGCLAWQKLKDLKEPLPVVEANADYRAEMDDLGQFLATCVAGEHCKTQAAVLFKAYQQWGGKQHETQKAFSHALTKRNYASKHSNTGTFWLGIGLYAPANDGDREY